MDRVEVKCNKNMKSNPKQVSKSKRVGANPGREEGQGAIRREHCKWKNLIMAVCMRRFKQEEIQYWRNAAKLLLQDEPNINHRLPKC